MTNPFLKPRWNILQGATEDLREAGQKLLAEGKVAVVLLAGGHGSRLGSQSPKGCFEISPIRHASLFQLFAEQIEATARIQKCEIPLLIWVSKDNEEATRSFWNVHHSWGLEPEFVVQPDLPLLDDDGQPVVDEEQIVIQAPNGNGSLWQTLATQGFLERWQERGIEAVVVIPVDNALAQPLEPTAIGAIARGDARALLLSTPRRTPEEAVGVVLQDEGRIAEYSELPDYAAGKAGWQRYPEGFIGIMIWSVAEAQAAAKRTMPLHLARKYVTMNGQKRSCWKQEFFLFDALAGIEGCGVLSVDRKIRFAPLKSAEGEYGVLATQNALIAAAQERMRYLGWEDVSAVRELHPDLWVMHTHDCHVDEQGWAEPLSCPVPN